MHREHGQTVVEYALIVAAIALVMVAFLVGFGTDIIEEAGDAALALF